MVRTRLLTIEKYGSMGVWEYESSMYYLNLALTTNSLDPFLYS